MKIEAVEGLHVGTSYIVRIRADSGLTGIGQTACWGYPEAVAQIVDKFRSYLAGQDPMRIEHHWQVMYRMGPFRGSARPPWPPPHLLATATHEVRALSNAVPLRSDGSSAYGG
jgi:L-alanine-DL-glutamate epimerase-like enolase superfamily enzyme